MEVPAETDALLNLHIQEFVGCDCLEILCCVADRCPEEAAVRLQNIHRLHDARKDTITAAKIIDLGEAFQGNGEAQVSDLADLLRKLIIDQSSVRVGVELTVMVLFAELQDVCLADKRLAACEHVKVYAKLLALRDDAVQVLEAQVQLVSILGRPAASAVQVAGGGRIHQDQPRDIAAVFLTVCADGLGSVDHRLKHQVEQCHLQNIRIQLVDQLVQVLVPLFIRIGKKLAEHRIGFF